MTLIDTTAPLVPAILDGPALWPAQAHVPTVLGRQLVIDRGEGSYVFTRDGRKLFDGTAGLWHANIGHSHPELARVAYEQMQRLETYHIFARYTNDKALALGERLAAIAPIERAKVILNSGGSDAIDVACKLARLAGTWREHHGWAHRLPRRRGCLSRPSRAHQHPGTGHGLTLASA